LPTVRIRCWLWALASVLVGLGLPARAEISYQTGHGLDLGDVNVAGYANLVGEMPQDRRTSLKLDDMSLFVTGHVNRIFNPFVELERTNQPLFYGTGPHTLADQPNMVLERIYNDTYLSDEFTLRAGKMHAPVGEWNQIHAAPLVLTTTRPLATQRGFSAYVSGASLLYVDAADELPEIQVYWQPVEDLAVRPKTLTRRRFRDVEGAHVNWPIGLTDKIGVSFQRSRTVGSDEDQLVYGANAKYSFYGFSIDAEATVSSISGGNRPLYRRNEGGAYVLGSYALSEQWSVFSWYEHYVDRREKAQASDALFGVAFRPIPSVVLKVERVKNFDANWGNPTGYFASLAVMF